MSTSKSSLLKRLWHGFLYLGQRFNEDDCANRAASLAYATLLSIVPMMMVSFYVLSWFPLFSGVGEKLQAFIVANFIADSANVIAAHLNHFLQQIRVLSMTNLVSLGVVAILMMFNMVLAFNAIWRVKMKRHLALSFLLYLIILLLTPILFGILIVMSSYLASLPLIADIRQTVLPPVLWTQVVPYIAAFVIFTFFNWVLPSCKVRLRHAAMAGLVTAILFEAAKSLFILYLQFYPTYKLLYGALATIPIFLVWIYVSWVVILFGAILCHISTHGIPHKNR